MQVLGILKRRGEECSSYLFMLSAIFVQFPSLHVDVAGFKYSTNLAMSAFIVPDGHAPPFASVTPTDHSAWIIIGTAFGLSCVLLFSVIRICARTSNAPRFALDDAFLASATVGLLGMSCVLQLHVANSRP